MNPADTAKRNVLLLVPEEGLLFEAAGIADIFYWANKLKSPESSQIDYQVTVATTLRHRVVHGRSGLSLLADSCLVDLDPTTAWDTIIVTGRGSSAEERRAITEWLKLAAIRARRDSGRQGPGTCG